MLGPLGFDVTTEIFDKQINREYWDIVCKLKNGKYAYYHASELYSGYGPNITHNMVVFYNFQHLCNKLAFPIRQQFFDFQDYVQ